MERCYEYYNCGETDCSMYGTTIGPQCWEVKGTLCSSSLVKTMVELVGNKEEVCEECAYRKAVTGHPYYRPATQQAAPRLP